MKTILWFQAGNSSETDLIISEDGILTDDISRKDAIREITLDRFAYKSEMQDGTRFSIHSGKILLELKTKTYDQYNRVRILVLLFSYKKRLEEIENIIRTLIAPLELPIEEKEQIFSSSLKCSEYVKKKRQRIKYFIILISTSIILALTYLLKIR
jgi:predicted nucleic acid-binding Zn ribbon protein